MTAVAAPPLCRGEWLEDPGFGVYVHIPFCAHRCHYCDFNTYSGQDDLFGPYADALVRDVLRWDGAARPATSVFFGGGTPTALEPGALAAILGAIRDRIGVARGAEVTVEANPETVDERVCDGLLAAGFNRISIGVQSLAPGVLAGLGRTHGGDRALAAIAAARRAGFASMNADVIFGSPWERAADWSATLDGVVAAAPDHVSAYALTVEDGTPLATKVATGRVADVDPDVQADRYEVAAERLASAGYARYEISNWARPGFACRHNLLYWSAGDYLGFGAGAHAHVEGRRWWHERLPRAFVAAVAAGRTVEAGSEVLGPDERAGEALVLGLRLCSGIPEDAFVRRFGAGALERRSAAVAEMCALGLVDRAGGRIRLSPEATLVANDVLCRLL